MSATGKIRARDGGLLGLALVGVLLLAIAVRSRPASSSQHTSGGGAHSPKSSVIQQRTERDTSGRSHPLNFQLHLAFLLRLLEVLALTAGILLVVFLVVRYLPAIKRRAPRRPAPSAAEDGPSAPIEPLADRVSAVFETAASGFRRGDHEAAIVGCWLRLEQLAESAGFARQRQETSSELAMRWSAVLPLTAQPLAELAELYREARFSNHRMTTHQVERAERALDRLRQDAVRGARRG